MNERRVYSVVLNAEELEADFLRLNAKKKRWYSIVESFIEDIELKRVYQLISVSDFTSEKPEQFFLEAAFNVTNNYRLDQIGERSELTAEKYYSELTSGKSTSIESKLRLTFKTDESRVSIEWLQSNKFAALQIESPKEIIDEESKRILRALTSIKISEKIDLTLEEAFYNQIFRR